MGLSKNGFKLGEIKYKGQYHFFSRFECPTPVNFKEKKVLIPTANGFRKMVSPIVIEEAKNDNLCVGTSIDPTVLKNSVNTTERSPVQGHEARGKVIDCISYSAEHGIPCELTTDIVTRFGNSSDHFGLFGRFKLDMKSAQSESETPTTGILLSH
jgi:hypothetical protein